MRKYIVLIVWMFMACSKPAGNIADETIIAPVDMDKCVDENGEALGFPVNQFLVFTNEPHPRADRMRQLAAEWGVELVGQIPDMGIWQLQCDCQTQAELEAFMELAKQRSEVEFAAHNFLLDLQGSVQKSSHGGLCRAGGDLDALENDFRLALDSVNYYSTVILFDKIKELISLSPVNILVMDGQFCLDYLQSQFADIASGLQVVGVNGEAAKQQDAQFCGQPGYGHGSKVLGILAADDDDGGVSGLLKRTLSTDFLVDIAPALAGKKTGNDNGWGVHTMEFFHGLHVADLRSAQVVNISMASIWDIDHINKICDNRTDELKELKCINDKKTERMEVRNKVQQLFEENEDILFVLAAGNHTLQIDKLISDPRLINLSFPQGIVSSKNNVIHVGAFDVPIKDTGVFGLWSGSNYSFGLARGLVTVYAPTSPPLLNNQSPDGLPVTITDDAGTSLSAPFVTALVAMIRAISPDLTPKEIIEEIIIPTAGLPIELPGGGLGRGIILFDAVARAMIMRQPVSQDLLKTVDRNQDGESDGAWLILVSGTLEMVRPPENPDDPTPDPTIHEFEGYIQTSFMLGDSENGVPMQGLYDTLETYCFHGLQ